MRTAFFLSMITTIPIPQFWKVTSRLSQQFTIHGPCGNRLDAQGVNASFPIAVIHRLLENLMQACTQLGKTPLPLWQEIGASLPRASIVE